MVSQVKKWLNKFKYAFEGLYAALKFDKSIRLQFTIGLLTCIVGLIIGLSAFEWLLVVMMIFLVITVEIINSAIEQLVNMVSPNYSPQAKIVKDLGAAAVLMVSALAVVIVLFIIGGRI